jgi:hypothetical protein
MTTVKNIRYGAAVFPPKPALFPPLSRSSYRLDIRAAFSIHPIETKALIGYLVCNFIFGLYFVFTVQVQWLQMPSRHRPMDHQSLHVSCCYLISTVTVLESGQ